MALPQLTPEQRAAAFGKAAQTCKVRAEFKDKLKRGTTDLSEVLKQADENEITDKMKISALLEALPKVGKTRAQGIMNDPEIAQTRRLYSPGDHQRRTLLERFGYATENQSPWLGMKMVSW